MKRDDVKDVVRNIFADLPEVCSIRDLIQSLEDAGLKVSYKNMRNICESLVDDGVLQPAGREGFESTIDFMEENGHDVTVAPV